MPTTQYTLDLSQYIGETQRLMQAMGGQVAGTEELIQSSIKFNSQMKQTNATFDSHVSGLQKVVRQYGELTRAQREAAATGGKLPQQLENTNLFLQNVKITTKKTTPIDPERVAAGLAAKEQLSGLFPAPGNATIGQMGKYETALNRVQKLLETGKVSKERFDEIFSTLKIGDSLNKLSLSTDEAKLASTISQLKFPTKTAKPQDPDKIAAGFASKEQLTQLFPAPTNATIGQMGKYESALNRVQQLLETGKVSKQRFDEIFNAVKSGDPLSKLKLNGDEAKLATAIGNIKDNFTAADKEASKFNLSLRNMVRIAEALVLKEAIGAVVNQLQRAAVEAATFQIKLSEIRTLSTENQSSFNAWSASIERVSNAFGIPQIEVAKAAYESLSSQVSRSREGTEQFLNSAANLARVGVSDIAEAGKLLASVFNAYNISADRAEEVSAKLFVAIDRGNFTAKDLAGNFGRVETTAATLGVKFEELLAAMTTLTRQGVNASDAQTQLSNVFLKLLNPSERAQKIMRSWGFESGQAAIAGLGFVGVLEKIEQATKGDAAALAEFGGEMRSIRGLIGLTTRGKGDEFKQDLAEIQNDAKRRFAEAKAIRGESAGDQLTIEVNKVKNFFTNELGQSAINSVNNITQSFGKLSDNVAVFTKGLIDVIKVWGIYKVSTTLATISQAGFNATLNVFNTKTGVESAALLAKNEQRAASLGKVMTGVGVAIAAAFVIDEIAKWKRELDEVGKKSEDYENTLKRIESRRQGKAPDGDTTGHKVFQETSLKKTDEFGSFVDKLFQSLAKDQATQAIAATRDLDYLKDKGKETALQLTEAFKRTGDSVHGLIKQHQEAFSKARAEVDKSKKSVLGYKESVESLKFDLDFEFANDADHFQKFELRDQQIQKMTREAEKLLRSRDEGDIDKGRQLAQDVLRKVKEDESERVRFQVEQDKARLIAQGGPRSGEDRFVRANTGPSKERLEEFANLFTNLEKDVQRRKKEEEDQNTKLINQDKDRLRLLDDRVKLFNQLKLFDEHGKVNSEFAGPNGKLDENKFSKTFDQRSKGITDLLKTEEEKVLLLPELEKARVNLLRQQTAEIRLQEILTKQLQSGNIQRTSKDEFERASKSKIEASSAADVAGRELGVGSEIVKGFLDRTKSDSQFSTGADDQNAIKRISSKILLAISDADNAVSRTLGGRDRPADERSAILQANQGEAEKVLKFQAELDKARAKLTERDASGKLTATSADSDNVRAISAKLVGQLDYLISKFTGQRDNENFAVPGGAKLSELRTQLNDAVNLFDKAKAQSDAADKIQANLEQQLSKIFTPAQIAAAKQEVATDLLAGVMTRAATATENLVREFQKLPQLAPPAAPSNVPLTLPGGAGYGGAHHFGGLIKGPAGYDNLMIRAEAGEFVMSQEATRAWLPQLIEMNNGRSPKMKGKYHEGGLVQTNVGDVNVTISGPVSPERNVRQIGKALRRQIRMGQLDLATGR